MSEQPPRKSRLWKKPNHWIWLGIPAGGFAMLLLGAIALGGFNYVIHETSSMEFCVSCHEMETNIFQAYKETPHYNNSSGIRTGCSDCHVPQAWGPKILRKTHKGLVEIPAKILGTISTPEKFEAKRLEMAERVWADMEATDSRECRSCHSLEAMANQDRRTAKKHSLERKADKNETCIDCHKGIAHQLPNGYIP
ncbi:NapC/NirT family cytochrome c [Teredinibacter franksiae]|uniref:NapC/NirT family cytochrome c n=1 Tax=Teredinibacter franksiae TaxID=2761453 RepID=UPI001C8AD882|nr:NapC/NirT family cytochrome c [Teredinibacter franksiae]